MRNDGTFGLIDSLTITYDGNRLVKVTDNAEALNYNGALDFHDGENANCEYEYVRPWGEIQYTSFHKVSRIGNGANIMELIYGPDKSRRKITRSGNGSTETKFYVGALYEQSSGSVLVKTCYIFAGDKAVAIYETKGNTTDMLYLHHDHLGSITAYSDNSGAMVQELSYDAWGRRRDPSTWECYNYAADAEATNPWGFTGHEHIDIFDMVNMDGRMYDPMTGRFLSPDPFMQAPDYTQGLNRYAYCLNNPLSLTDPTGYNWWSDNWKSLLATAVGITVAALTAGTASSASAAIIAGAAGGAAGALTGAVLNGANIDQVAKATLTGAFWGGVSGFFNFASADELLLAKIYKHTFSQGWLEGIQGGNMFHGMMMGAVSGVGGHYIDKYHDTLGKVGEITTSAVLGGTVDELGGGKFANGAITSAYSVMFNDMIHNKERIKKAMIRKIKKQIEADGELSFMEAYLWYKIGNGKSINVDASKIDLNFLDPSTLPYKEDHSVSIWFNEGGSIRQGIVYGNITINYQGNNIVVIRPDEYNFEMHNWKSFGAILRNVETRFADIIHGNGTNYKNNFKGANTIHHNWFVPLIKKVL